MLEDTPKTKNVYVPLALIGLAVVLMLVEVLFLGNHASHGALEVRSTVVGKTILYGLVLLLGIGLCSWFGYQRLGLEKITMMNESESAS